jgi:hypothetical protein
MKRQSPPKAAASIALFPFLAVLLCTMGGLIILLVVIARHAKQQAAVDSQSTITARDDLEVRRSDLQWRRDHLRAARDKTAEDLADRRKVISHLEDHVRRLRDQISQLERATSEFEHDAAAKQQDTAKLRARLEDLRQQTREAQEEIDKNRRSRPKSQSYAIIPYDGPHQTHRRPIYIECRENAIVLQPEGIELADTDFIGPPGPGNPLAAGLRAAREYLVKYGGNDPAGSGEPYPLLLVRPDGILAYYTAREAMSSWGSDFGYEFIDQNWEIKFKPPEAGLAVAISRAVDDARHRQQALALAAPRLLTSRQRQAYRAGRAGNAAAGNVPGSRGAESGSVGTNVGSGVGGNLTPEDVVGLYGPEAGVKKQTSAGSGSATGPAPGSAAAENSQSAGAPSAGSVPPSKAPASALLKVDVDQGRQPAGGNSVGGQGSAASEGPALKGLETPGKTFASASHSSTNGAGDPDGSMSPPTAEEVRTPKRSLAMSRGKDWSLPGDHYAAVAVTRPIRVRCYGDHLVVMQEPGERLLSQIVGLDYRTQDAVDPLVAAIHTRIDSWGIAGRGMYWRPTLVFEIAPDGKARAADLRELLTDSGLEVREKNLAAAPAGASPRY